ncbi:MAG TPA: hypothetical protein VFC67_01570 [Prolixibacteraceae bacterium]|nr:hypothetical protein [Prolixibacteraceae bacterium]
MDFTQHLITYYKGQQFEAVLLTALGVVLLFIAIIMWQHLNQNQMLKGLFYPIAFLSVFSLFAGGFNSYSNNQRINNLPLQYATYQNEFARSELYRFEGMNGVN